MPIYEFICKNCNAEFDKLTVYDWKNAGIKCPRCESIELDRLVSQVSGYKSSTPTGTTAPVSSGNSACSGCHGNCKTCH